MVAAARVEEGRAVVERAAEKRELVRVEAFLAEAATAKEAREVVVTVEAVRARAAKVAVAREA
eukprot:5300527-Prymnesium_polylepis.1